MIDIRRWIPLIHTQSTLDWQPVHSLFTLNSMAQSNLDQEFDQDSIDQVSIKGHLRVAIIDTWLWMPLMCMIQIFTNHKPGLYNQIITKHDLTLWGRFYPSLMMLQLLQLIAASESVKNKRYIVHVHFIKLFPFYSQDWNIINCPSTRLALYISLDVRYWRMIFPQFNKFVQMYGEKWCWPCKLGMNKLVSEHIIEN